ncbi:MAG: 3-deoxy-7-phosphoheptulonate synthase [Candidatus Hydrogenedentota bacterium]|nr:MAG: 3-deoxy-7-phosphoheptulonate synthase [Candidatus Hydrogenedentota bacterium]
MIIVMAPGHTPEERARVEETIRSHGYRVVPIVGELRTVIAAVGDGDKDVLYQCESFPGVESAMRVLTPYKFVAKVPGRLRTVINVANTVIGEGTLRVIAGPCSVETEEGYLRIAKAVKEAGADLLRGGAFKPRTSPYSFQGLGEEGLRILARVGKELGLGVVTEVMSRDTVELVASYADILQIGARNMHNFALLKEVGRCEKPVFLKRGIAATIEEFLMAAEYIVSAGNPNVILCERGIRTFETATRFTLDINAVAVLKKRSHLPVFVDPSHATGHWELVAPAAKAAVAAGADGLMIEVHDDPASAVSDGIQSLLPHRFAALMHELRGKESAG